MTQAIIMWAVLVHFFHHGFNPMGLWGCFDIPEDYTATITRVHKADEVEEPVPMEELPAPSTAQQYEYVCKKCMERKQKRNMRRRIMAKN
jgi:hypothetical protein